MKALPVLVLGGFDSIRGGDRRRVVDRRDRKARRSLYRPVSSAAASKAGSPMRSLSPSCSSDPADCSARSSSRGSRRCRPSRSIALVGSAGRLDGARAAYCWSPTASCPPSAPAISSRRFCIAFLALSLAALGLNLLTGYAGQVSLGTAAFMAVGAFTAYNCTFASMGFRSSRRLILAGLAAAAIGIVFGLPSLRLRGFYLAVSTLAAQFFVKWALTKFGWFSNYNPSGVIDAPPLRVAGVSLRRSAGRYLFALTIVAVSPRWPGALVRLADRTQLHRHPRQRDRREDHRRARAANQAARVRSLLFHHRRRGRALGIRLSADGRARRVQPRPFVRDSVHHHHRRTGHDPRRVLRRGAHRRLSARSLARRSASSSADVFDSAVARHESSASSSAPSSSSSSSRSPTGLLALWDRLTRRLFAAQPESPRAVAIARPIPRSFVHVLHPSPRRVRRFRGAHHDRGRPRRARRRAVFPSAELSRRPLRGRRHRLLRRLHRLSQSHQHPRRRRQRRQADLGRNARPNTKSSAASNATSGRRATRRSPPGIRCRSASPTR